MKLAALVSGGKDSIAAAWLAQKAGHEIKYFISVQPATAESYMFHYPNVKFVRAQAEAAGLPILSVRTSGEKEKELAELKTVLWKIQEEVGGVVSGAIASDYQKSRIDKLCEELKLKSIAPLWQTDVYDYWNLLLKNKFEVVITAVAAAGLDKDWLGKIIDEKSLAELKELATRYRFSLVGEGGEFETFVLSCPLFSKKILIESAEKTWNEKEQNGLFVIKKTKFSEK